MRILYTTSAELARLKGTSGETIRRRIRDSGILPDCYLAVGRRTPLPLYNPSRRDILKLLGESKAA